VLITPGYTDELFLLVYIFAFDPLIDEITNEITDEM
jgi:hypothetical protein